MEAIEISNTIMNASFSEYKQLPAAPTSESLRLLDDFVNI